MGAKEIEIIDEKIVVDVHVTKKRFKWLQFEYFINLINQTLIGFVTIYVSWLCIEMKLVHVHCWLCTIGYSLLMAEGVMTHYNGNVALFSYRREAKTTIHSVLQALGGSIGIAGSIVIMCQITVHFKTVHGCLGFAALILSAVSMITGLSALFAKQFRSILSPLLNKAMHNFLGIATFVIALVAQFYGYKTFAFEPDVKPSFLILIEVITLTSMVLCSYGPIVSLLYKFVDINQ